MKDIVITAVAIVLTIAFSACGNSKKETDGKTSQHHSSDSTHNHSEEAHVNKENTIVIEETTTTITKKQAEKILSGYLEIKDALVQANGVAASEAATKLVNEMGDIADDKLAKKIRSDAEHIASTHDVSHQRDHLNSFSKNVFSLIKQTKANNTALYLQSCPMEKSNKEALWLSLDTEIINPYFGVQMLNCGNMEDTLNTK